MKRVLSVFISLCLLFGTLTFVSISAYSESIYGDYLFEINNEEAIIVKYLGNDTTVRIPNKIYGYEVTEIYNYAFSENEDLKSVILPIYLKTIGDSAFSYCSSLESLTIPEGVIRIGASAFEYCMYLEEISLPDSVISIGNSAFTATGYYLDNNNWYNNALYMNNCLLSLMQYSYNEETEEKELINLGDYSVKDGTKLIADGAFSYCLTLETITIPASVNVIGETAFDSCEVLTAINVDAENADYSSENGVLFDKNKTQIIKYPEAKSENSYEIPNTVENVCYKAFNKCSNLTEIIIPEGVTAIGESAFEYCTKLAKVDLPDSVTSIGKYALANCDLLSDVKIGNNVINAGANILSYTAYSSNEENWENGVLYLGSCLIAVKKDISGEYSIKDGTKVIAEGSFSWCEALTGIKMPNSVVTIEDAAFEGCASLENVNISDSVVSVGERAFYHCLALKQVTVPKNVTKIGDIAFGYTYNPFNDEYVQYISVNDFVLNGYSNSAASEYANEYDVYFNALDVVIPNSTTVTPITTVCSHSSVLTGAKASTYFADGYTGDKVCSKCKTVISKGKVIKKLTLATPNFKLKSSQKSFKVTYKKVSDATGFQIRYKTGTGKWKTKTYNTKKSVTKAVKGLKKGKKYSVQIRSIVKQNGKTACGSWSNTKKIKIK